MEPGGQERVIRHYERLQDYLFDINDDGGMEQLKQISNG